MSDNKHSVVTDALETLGTVIDENAARDAIHVAVEPATAGVSLKPGQHVLITDEGVARPAGVGKGMGIVDPFLHKNVSKGEMFWLLVYPRTITSLRHVWAHPDFDGVVEISVARRRSEEWLRAFCERGDCPDYEDVMRAASQRNRNRWDPDYLHFDGQDAHGTIPPEFWTHFEIVSETTVPVNERAKYFSCGC